MTEGRSAQRAAAKQQPVLDPLPVAGPSPFPFPAAERAAERSRAGICELLGALLAYLADARSLSFADGRGSEAASRASLSLARRASAVALTRPHAAQGPSPATREAEGVLELRTRGECPFLTQDRAHPRPGVCVA